MAGNVNKVLLMGNLTRDVELRPAGESQVANFGLAVNRRFRTSSGEDREETTFVDCEMWGARGQALARYLGKGDPVFLEGRLKLDTWQDNQSGQNRSKLRVVVENFEFIGGGRGGGGGGGGDQASPQVQTRSSQPAHQPMSEDDIPF